MATLQAAKQTSPVNVEQRKRMDIRAGDTVRVWTKVVEKGKTRLQAFEGLVLARKHGSEPGATFTVRKVSSGVGVERIFPLYSPNVEKIEVVKRAKTRRAKLYYIREKAAKEIRRKMKATTSVPTTEEEQAPDEEGGSGKGVEDTAQAEETPTEEQNGGQDAKEENEEPQDVSPEEAPKAEKKT